MEKTTRITKAMRFEDIKAEDYQAGEKEVIPDFSRNIEDAVDFIDHEVNLLAKKNSGENKKQTKTQQENEGYKALILEFLATLSDTSAGVTCTEIIKGVAEFEGFSTQKISPLVRQLMAADKVTKTEVKGKALFRLA